MDPTNVAGRTIAFNMRKGQVDIEEGSDEDQRVRHAIQQPGDYSISSLYLTFNGANTLLQSCLDLEANFPPGSSITNFEYLSKLINRFKYCCYNIKDFSVTSSDFYGYVLDKDQRLYLGVILAS